MTPTLNGFAGCYTSDVECYLLLSNSAGQPQVPIGIQQIDHKNHKCTFLRHEYTRTKYDQPDVSRQSKSPVTVNHLSISKLC